MKKRGLILADTAIKIVIASICIVILILLLTKLYSVFVAKSELEEATSHLDNIEAIARGLSENQVQYYILTNPLNWHLISFPEEKALCFCPIKTEWVWTKFDKAYWLDICAKRGVCKNNVKISVNAKYYNPSDNNIWSEYGVMLFEIRAVYISKENGETYIRDYNKQVFYPYVDKILSLMDSDVIEQTKKDAIARILITDEKETNRRMAVVIEHKDKGTMEIIPDINIKSEIGRNFVVSGEKNNIAVYLIVKRMENE